jgi:hypothetical protein
MSEPITRDPDTVKIRKSEFEFIIEVSERLSVIETRLDSIDKKMDSTGNVVSGITTDRSELRGAWKAFGIVVAAMTAFAGIFAWLWENVFSKRYP